MKRVDSSEPPPGWRELTSFIVSPFFWAQATIVLLVPIFFSTIKTASDHSDPGPLTCLLMYSALRYSGILYDGYSRRTKIGQVSSTGSLLAHQYFFNTLASNGDFLTRHYLPQQFLYFLPLPQGQGPLRDGLPTIVSFGFSVSSSNMDSWFSGASLCRSCIPR